MQPQEQLLLLPLTEPQELQELQPQPVLVPPTEPQELQELQPQPVPVPATEPLQQGLQQEFATKSGNQIPLEQQELQAIKKSS